jgi:chlorophyllide a reductase subunit Y
VVQKAKELAVPSLYFTNLISARPLMGVAGAGSLAQVVNAAMNGRERFQAMREFFEGVGEGERTGVWEPGHVPDDATLEKRAKKAKRGKAKGPIPDSVVQDDGLEAADAKGGHG